MPDAFVELKSTENQNVYVRKSAVDAFEIVPASTRVEGHIKLYVHGVKFLIAVEKDELLIQLNG